MKPSTKKLISEFRQRRNETFLAAKVPQGIHMTMYRFRLFRKAQSKS